MKPSRHVTERRLDPRAKAMLWVACVGVGLLLNAATYLAGFVMLLCMAAMLAGSAKACFRFALKIAAPTAAMLLLVYGFLVPADQQESIRWLYGVQVSIKGIVFSLTIVLRLLTIGLSTIVFVKTTPLAEVAEALRAARCPAAVTAVLIASFNMHDLVVRKIRQIADAQKSRGMYPHGLIWGRVRVFLPLLRPLFHGLVLGAVERSSLWVSRGYLRTWSVGCRKLRPTDIACMGLACALVVGAGLVRWLL